MRWFRIVGIATGLAILGCGAPGGSDSAGGDGTETGPDGTDVDAVDMDAAPDSLTALQPAFQPIGEAGVAPTELRVRFDRPVVTNAVVGKPAGATSLLLQPAVQGQWTWSSPSTVTFEPANGFAPAQSYRVQLASIDSKWGTIGGAPVLHTFETPGFEVVSANRAILDDKVAQMDVVFSGPVSPDSASQVSFSVKGRRLTATPMKSGRANRLRFSIPRKSLPEGELNVEVRIEAGAASAVDPSAKTGRQTFKVELDTSIKPVEILRTQIKESADGFYLDILCSDAAVGETNYWWDRQNYESFQVTERCVLSADSLDLLTITPSAENLYIAEARRGFRVFGDFPTGDIEVELAAGAFTVDGGTLQKAYTANLTVPQRTPRVELIAKNGRYLPKGAWANLPIRHLNTDGIEVTILKVPPQNLVYWLSNDDESATARTADVVARETIKVNNPNDTVHTSWVDVAAMVGPDTQGLYEIRVEPLIEEAEEVVDLQTDTGWRPPSRDDTPDPKGDVARVVLTDLHLVAKASEDVPGADWPSSITAWAIRSTDNTPASNTVIDAVKPSGFVAATCRTGSDGSCELKLPTEMGDLVDLEAPIALVARRMDELTYLKFADLRTSVSEHDVSGASWVEGSPYDASLYTDRGVYRPGDTVRFGTILRAPDHRAPTDTVPMVLSILDPRRKTVKTANLTPDSNGMATWDLSLAAFASTGNWVARLEIGDETVSTQPFQVEEFVPERMKVEATLPASGILATDASKVEVDARYLFGGSAEGSRVEVRCKIQPSSFKPAQNKQFQFGPIAIGTESALQPVSVSERDLQLDATGHASADCGGLQGGYAQTGQLVADIAVFEAGSGRSTRATAMQPVHPEQYYLGLDTGVEKAKRGQTIPITGKVVDWDGKGVGRVETIEVTFFRLEEEYGWWWWDNRGEESYDLYLRRVEEGATTVKPGADGSFKVEYTPRSDAAGYLVRATAGRARTDLRIKGSKQRYWWSSGEGQVDRTPRPAKPAALAVTLPEQISVGQSATASVQVPYRGRMLMTVETDELLTHEWVDVEPGPMSWDFSIEAFVPNLYVSAFLIKDPKVDSPQGFTPERGFGVARTRVDPVDFRLPVELSVPGEVRSNSSLPVEVDLGAAGANASVTIAAVDQGILSLTGFQSPDPIADVFPRRELGIETFETVGWSILMPAGTSASHGGDGGGAGGRVQAVKPVALWSGKLTAGADGKATVTLDVPQYRGELRVMVVAATDARVGSADETVIVRDPLVLQTTLPRFLTADDTFQVPVFVTNMSGADKDVVVSLTAENLPWPGMPADPNAASPITFLGAKQTTVSIPNGKSEVVAFQAKATAQVGAARFRVKVESGNLVSTEELDVPFAPAGPRSRTVQMEALADGVTDLNPMLTNWLPTTERSTVWVTANPYGDAMGHLKHLVRYPHGCIEQTTSSTRPLLFVQSLVPAILPEVHGDELEKMVTHGVDRVLSMQTPSGGFAYWPGGSRPTPWGTAYATHMLLDARDQQYAVPEQRLEDALDWLEAVTEQTDGNTRSFDRYRDSAPYAHFVLARAGRGNKARVKGLLTKLGTPDKGAEQEAQYLLHAALYLAGDRSFEGKLRDLDTSSISDVRKNNWSFYSDLRRRGFMLSIYQDLFGSDDAGGETLAQLVANGLRNQSSSRYSTQELVWGITGLGKRVVGNASKLGTVTLKANGRELEGMAASTKGTTRFDPMWSVPRASERDLSVSVAGSGGGKMFVVVSSEGVQENAVLNTGGKGLKLERTYRNAEGNPLDLATLALGDMVYATVSITNTGKERVQNIAMVDRFPAGLEVENPRLGRGNSVDWIDRDALWDADHMDLRDDRLALFGHLDGNETRVVTYALRAVTAGEFTVPPVEAEAMYDPNIWARQVGGKAKVAGPWTDELL